MKKILLTAALLASTSASLSAQTFGATGTGAWNVMCTQLTFGAGYNPCPSAVSTPATTITVAPGGWAAVPYGPQNARYVGVNSTGTLVDPRLNENVNYSYVFSQNFFGNGFGFGESGNVNAYASLKTTFWLDNYFSGIYICNSSDVCRMSTTSVSPTPVAPNGENFFTEFQAEISDFQYGDKSIQFRTSGNGVTDGLLAYGNFTPVPEPSTYALFGFGLFGIAAARRRRQNS
jgi:hypothetical protein